MVAVKELTAEPSWAGQVIRAARGARGWSQDDLLAATVNRKFKDTGVSKGALQALETGKHKKDGKGPNAGTIMRLVRAFGVDSLEELAASIGMNGHRHSGQESGMIPHFHSGGKVAASWDGERNHLQLTEHDADDWVTNPRPEYPDAFSITVDGDSMEPDIPNGMRVIGSQSAKINTGDVCLCFGVDDDQCLLRQVIFDDDREFVTLRPFNPKYLPKRFQFRESSIRLVRVVAKWSPM